MKFNNPFKKPEPVVEKPAISLTEMKVKYALFSKKCDVTIKKYQERADRKIQRATELKLKGLPADKEIKAYTRLQSKINGVERRKDMFLDQLDMMEDIEIEKEFVGHLNEMLDAMSGVFADNKDMNEIYDKIIKENMKLNEKTREIEDRMNELDSVIDAYDSVTTSDLTSVEAGINAMIDQTISDARLSTGHVSAEEVANQVRNKLTVDA